MESQIPKFDKCLNLPKRESIYWSHSTYTFIFIPTYHLQLIIFQSGIPFQRISSHKKSSAPGTPGVIIVSDRSGSWICLRKRTCNTQFKPSIFLYFKFSGDTEKFRCMETTENS